MVSFNPLYVVRGPSQAKLLRRRDDFPASHTAFGTRFGAIMPRPAAIRSSPAGGDGRPNGIPKPIRQNVLHRNSGTESSSLRGIAIPTGPITIVSIHIIWAKLSWSRQRNGSLRNPSDGNAPGQPDRMTATDVSCLSRRFARHDCLAHCATIRLRRIARASTSLSGIVGALSQRMRARCASPTRDCRLRSIRCSL